MKYEIGQKVKVAATGRKGEIKAFRHEGFVVNGKIEEVIKYYVFFQPYSNEWFKEDQLSNTYTFDNKFQINLSNFLIDLYLKNRKFDLVKQLHEEKQLYMR
jgi:hypothetical protein